MVLTKASGESLGVSTAVRGDDPTNGFGGRLVRQATVLPEIVVTIYGVHFLYS